MTHSKKPPTIIKIISVGFFIAGILLLCLSIVMIAASQGTSKGECGLGCGIGLLIGFLGLIIVPFGILNIVTSIKLWKGRSFWRGWAIVLSFLFYLFMFMYLINNLKYIIGFHNPFFKYTFSVSLILTTVITSVIFYYLFYTKSSIEFFSKKK